MTAYTLHACVAGKTTVALLLGMLLLAGCEKRPEWENSVPLARSHALPDLVVAGNTPVFDPKGAPYAEAVWTNGVWNIHDQGGSRAQCRSEDEIYGAMKVIRGEHADSRILISAGCDTVFGEIKKIIRGAARAGFWRVDFLVSTDSQKGTNHTFLLELPHMGGSEPTNEIEPFMISIDAEGRIHTGSGPHRTMQDSDSADPLLPKLSSQLALYSAAARAAQCQPSCMVHVDSSARYQRVIDLLSRFHEYKINQIMFTDLTDRKEATCDGMNFERIERMELLKSKPLPTPPSSLPRSVDP